MTDTRRHVLSFVAGGLFAAALASALLAPVLHTAWCADAPAGGESMCGSATTSLLGIETNVWLWVGSVAVIIVGTVVLGVVKFRLRRGS